jgi:hypothetical protein
MDAYHIALFLHIVTLIVAASATAITKVAVGRRIKARTIREALEWHNVLLSTSKLFPMCLASFVLTGAYMVSVLGARAWATGFAIAGLVGVTLLLASGTFLGIKGNALKQVLERMAANGADNPVPKLVPPPLVTMLPLINTGIALAVVFDMVAKPASVLVALGVIAFGIGASAAIGFMKRRARPNEAPMSPTLTPTATP